MESVEQVRPVVGMVAGPLLSRRVRELFRVYPKALVGEIEAIHDLRVAARRLRSALSLLVEKPRGRRAARADRTLRDLARAAGRGRDLDVVLEILESIPSALDEGALRLRRALRASRGRARVLSREALLDLDIARLRRDLRALAASTHVDRPAVAERVAALRQCEEAIVSRELGAARAHPSAEALHGVRRAARRLRYAAEISDLVEGADSGGVDRWRRLQTLLGDIQDRHVLGVWLTAAERRARQRGDATLAAAATRTLYRVRRDAASRTRAFLASKAAPISKPLD